LGLTVISDLAQSPDGHFPGILTMGGAFIRADLHSPGRTRIVSHLVFFCGHAGTGKTTLARRLIRPLMHATALPFCLLDKDILYGSYSAAVMTLLSHDPNDRDSPLFLEHLRDPEYRSLIDTARDNLEAGISAIVVAPLSRELREGKLFDHAWLRIHADVKISVVWVHVAEDVAHARIVWHAAIRSMRTSSRTGTNIVSDASCLKNPSAASF
jgi:predicted kinase